MTAGKRNAAIRFRCRGRRNLEQRGQATKDALRRHCPDFDAFFPDDECVPLGICVTIIGSHATRSRKTGELGVIGDKVEPDPRLDLLIRDDRR